ncbi:MAG: hypothetical protein ACKO3P_09490, partial [Planctomycetaceae bacterium]
IVPHPRLPRLYLVGWGHPALSHVELDEAGHFRGDGVNQSIGGYGKYALAFDPRGRRAYLGTYPSTLEVVDLDEQGLLSGPPRTLAIANGPQTYLVFASGPRGLYFAGPDQRLAWWPLDAAGEPAPAPRFQVGPPLEALARGRWSEGLLAAIPRLETDLFNHSQHATGTQPVRIPLTDEGAPGPPQPLCDGSANAKTTVLGLGTGLAAAVAPQPPEFRLNRIRGLELRATLHEIESPGVLPPQVEATTVGPEQVYLRFALSARGDRLHTVVGGAVVTFDTTTADPAQPLTLPSLASARLQSRPLRAPTGQLTLDDRHRRLLSAQTTGELEVLPLDD